MLNSVDKITINIKFKGKINVIIKNKLKLKN